MIYYNNLVTEIKDVIYLHKTHSNYPHPGFQEQHRHVQKDLAKINF